MTSEHLNLHTSDPAPYTRYFFHLAKGTERILDVTGAEIIDIDSVLGETLAAFLVFRRSGETDWDGWFLEVTDEGDRGIFRFDLGMMGRAFEWVGDSLIACSPTRLP